MARASNSPAAAGGTPARSPSPSLRRRGSPQEQETTSAKASGNHAHSKLRSDLKTARKNTTLFRAPITTLTVFAQVLFDWILSSISFVLSNRPLSYSLAGTILTSLAIVLIAGPQSEFVLSARHNIWFVVWWVGLGILSSVGLGTGLHTFVLYLGPYIAMVTFAVTECETMNVVGDSVLECPPVGTVKVPVTFLRILLKVLPACFLWGAGTAIGELPPYFVSRAARLSGEKLAELDELEEEDRGEKVPPTLVDRMKLLLFHALQSWGFWAIVLCASVPNPLFDLAGLTCGHFLVPFWTFFGATFLGKAVVKVQIQAAFVILAFDKDRLDWIIAGLESALPFISGKLGPLFEKQRAQFHHNQPGASHNVEEAGWLSFAWNMLLGFMLLWFVKSIIESSVQERLAERDRATLETSANGWERSGVTTRLQEKAALEAAVAASLSQEKGPVVPSSKKKGGK